MVAAPVYLGIYSFYRFIILIPRLEGGTKLNLFEGLGLLIFIALGIALLASLLHYAWSFIENHLKDKNKD